MNIQTPAGTPVVSTPSSGSDLKRANPHEPSLGKFLRGRERPVTTGYVRGGNSGQIIREDTLERWRREEENAKGGIE